MCACAKTPMSVFAITLTTRRFARPVTRQEHQPCNCGLDGEAYGRIVEIDQLEWVRTIGEVISGECPIGPVDALVYAAFWSLRAASPLNSLQPKRN